MQDMTITIGMLFGGLGIFLLAVSMITEGLKLAAGNALHVILGKWTKTAYRSIIAGISITALIQSSSAVTVAIIGFVNAGLVSLYQALGVVFGANIGTTTTGWLVATIGFNIKIEAFALPMVGIGMMLQIFGKDSKKAPLGTALAGFGLFFVGIDVLRDAFEGITSAIDLQRITADGIPGIMLFLVIGFFITVVTQSSSAAIAITLTAATGGIVGPYAAAAMVIGANVGTTSTAVLSVIGATPNAKRVAAAHVVFNVVTGLVALLILPVLFGIVKGAGSMIGLQDIPVVTLALFHTIFNVLGVLIMWPFMGKMEQKLGQYFTSYEEMEGRPRYLDKNTLVSPSIALNALILELGHVSEIARRMSKTMISQETESAGSLRGDRRALRQLVKSIGEFTVQLQRSAIPKEIAMELPKVLRTSQYYHMTAELVMDVSHHLNQLGEISDPDLLDDMNDYKRQIIQLLDATDLQSKVFSLADCDNRLKLLNVRYDQLKNKILEKGVASGLDIGNMSAVLEHNSNLRRLVTQMVKAAHYQSGLALLLDIPPALNQLDEQQNEVV